MTINFGYEFGTGSLTDNLLSRAGVSNFALGATDAELRDVVTRYHDLVPVGSTGIYITPNDPVSPTDCRRWPNSPYCDGGGPIVDPLGGQGVGGGAEIAANKCEVCITVTPALLWMSGPPYTVCYRRPDCRPDPIKEPLPWPDNESGPEFQPLPPQAPPGFCRILVGSWFRRKAEFIEDSAAGTFVGPAQFFGGFGPNPPPNQAWADPSSSSASWVDSGTSRLTSRTYERTDSLGRKIYSAYQVNGFIRWRDYGQNSSTPDLEGYTLIYNSCNRVAAPPYISFPTSRGPEEMACNCSEIEDLLRDIHTRLGCNQFPVEVPKSIYGGENKTEELGDVPSLFAWWVYQFDALVGEWPIEIEIEDEDPLKKGNQTKKLELPNMAETMAELFGLVYKTDTTTDVSIEILLRLIPEIIGIKNASLITQDYAKANASFLGYKGNPIKRKIPYNFNVEKLDSLPELMETCEKYVLGWQDDDDENVVAYLQRLMFSAGIIKAAFMRDKTQVASFISSLADLWSDDKFKDVSWDAFVKRLENPLDPINRGAIPRPDASDPRKGS